MRPPARTSRQGVAVGALLAEFDGFASAQQLHAELQRRGERVGLTTVYRHLQAWAEAGVLDSLRGPDGELVYRQCGARHHHHLVCRRCGRTVEVEGSAVERWAEQTARAAGFTEVEHSLEIFGVCAPCAGSASPR